MVPKNRKPTHPGVILRKLIEETDGLTQEKLAAQIGVTYQSVSAVVNGHRSVTAEMAVRLSKRFEMSPQFWLNMQNAVDLFNAQQELAAT